MKKAYAAAIADGIGASQFEANPFNRRHLVAAICNRKAGNESVRAGNMPFRTGRVGAEVRRRQEP